MSRVNLKVAVVNSFCIECKVQLRSFRGIRRRFIYASSELKKTDKNYSEISQNAFSFRRIELEIGKIFTRAHLEFSVDPCVQILYCWCENQPEKRPPSLEQGLWVLSEKKCKSVEILHMQRDWATLRNVPTSQPCVAEDHYWGLKVIITLCTFLQGHKVIIVPLFVSRLKNKTASLALPPKLYGCASISLRAYSRILRKSKRLM